MPLFLITATALIAFAANSILTRAALENGETDALLFSLIRIGAGAGALTLLLALRTRRQQRERSPGLPGTWRGAFWLLLYVLPFSLAYLSLSTGTGALVLFGMVQVTMIVAGYRAGERPTPLKWLGMGGAACGLVLLVLPGLTAPPLGGASLMGLAGVAWGLYSLDGRKASDPLRETAGNFQRAVPGAVLGIALLAALPSLLSWKWTAEGVALAACSGALTSGVGYAIWYAALPRLRATTAATLQLTVPVIASFGGLLFMNESISQRLAATSLLILGGALIATWAGNRPSATPRRQ